MNEKTQPFTVGIIGFGRIGAEHAGWISANESLRVGGVFDPTPARRAIAIERGFATSDSIDALLSDPAIDAILVATPSSMHFEHAMAAVAAGKHVMVEKPVTLDAASAQVLKDAAEQRGVTLSVFHCRRFDLDYVTVGNMIRAGKLGRVFNVESRLGQWDSCVGPAAKEYRPGWRNESAFGGGALYDWGSHFIDQLWQLMLPAKPVRVFAQLRGNVWSTDCDDFARVLIDFDNGATGLCEINTTTTQPLPRWHIDGTKGSATAPYSRAFDTKRWATVTMVPPELGDVIHAPWPLGGSLKVETEQHIWRGFAACIQSSLPPWVTMESVMTTMRLLDAARESSLRGAVITL